MFVVGVCTIADCTEAIAKAIVEGNAAKAGKLQREGRAVQVRHVAEVLAGMMDVPPIGEPG